MMFPSGVTITIERSNPGGFDEYGDPIPGTVDTHDIARCAVHPRMSTELDTEPGRAGIVIGYTLYAPGGSDIRPDDRIVHLGVRYEIDGEPGDWVHPSTGWNPGVTVALKRAAG